MREDKAFALYHDYLSRVKSNYAQKKEKFLVDKSQFNNFGQQLLCLPAKSRARVKKKIEKRLNYDNQTVRMQNKVSLSKERDRVKALDSSVNTGTHDRKRSDLLRKQFGRV